MGQASGAGQGAWAGLGGGVPALDPGGGVSVCI